MLWKCTILCMLTSNEELPDYLSILRNDQSLFPDDDFLFVDPHLNGLVLDPVHDASLRSCKQTLSRTPARRVLRDRGTGMC